MGSQSQKKQPHNEITFITYIIVKDSRTDNIIKFNIMFQPETLQRAALLVYGKRFVMANQFEIERATVVASASIAATAAPSATHAAGDKVNKAAVNSNTFLKLKLEDIPNLFLNPPTLMLKNTNQLPSAIIKSLYKIIIEEFEKCLAHLEQVRRYEDEEIHVNLYLSPVFPENLVNFIEKRVGRKKSERGVRYGWIKNSKVKDFHYLIFETGFKFTINSVYYDLRGTWRPPLNYPDIGESAVKEVWNQYVAEQAMNFMRKLLADLRVPLLIIG